MYLTNKNYDDMSELRKAGDALLKALNSSPDPKKQTNFHGELEWDNNVQYIWQVSIYGDECWRIPTGKRINK